jgi:hypothetical protein
MELEQLDLNKIDGRGKWSNRSLDDRPNTGSTGKLTAEQIEERLNLHARRLANGVPTISAIVSHWKNKYGIYMHQQSEKDWAIKHKNSIMQRQEELITKGEIQIIGVSDKSLVAALADGARSEASMLRIFEGKMKKLANNINTIVDTWDILGIKKEDYLNTVNERREMLDKKAELEIKSKKDNLEFLKGFSIISKNCAEKLIEMIKLA